MIELTKDRISEAQAKVSELSHRSGNNAARADAKSVTRIAADMAENGFDADYPIIVEARWDETEDWTIIDGRHRALAAKEAGIEEVPVLVVDWSWKNAARKSFGGFVGKVRRMAGYEQELVWA